MELEQKKLLAVGMKKNPLLPVLLDERSKEIHEAWEGEQDADKREQIWYQLNATTELRDFLYGRINELAKLGDE